MTINLIKLAVGSESIETLHDWQSGRVFDYHGQSALPVYTRHKPLRDKELLKDGSIYWVINRRIQVRQKLLGFETDEDHEGRRFCLIIVDPQLVRTVAQPHRPFQGWRYFDPAKAPADRGVFNPLQQDEAPPEEMEAELRAAGLID